MIESKVDSLFLPGERIYLRRLQLEDVTEAYQRWMNDAEVTKYLESRFYPASPARLREYVKAKSSDPDTVFLAICVRDGERHIGNVKLGPINWIHRFADVGILIGEKNCWGRGYASESIGLLVRYAFAVLNLHKLTAGCYQVQKASVRAFRKNGFQIEGVRKKHYLCNGIYVDAVLLGLVKPDETNDER